jgi:hypothetical protein
VTGPWDTSSASSLIADKSDRTVPVNRPNDRFQANPDLLLFIHSGVYIGAEATAEVRI